MLEADSQRARPNEGSLAGQTIGGAELPKTGKLGTVCRQRGLTLKATSARDFSTLRALFDQPAFLGWGGAGRLPDSDIRTKYLGFRYPEVECFLVLLDGTAVGLAQLHVADHGDGGGMDLVLLPEVRGQGLGRQVVAQMVRRAHVERGWRRFTVDPDLANQDGVRFWRAVGFQPEQTVADEPNRAPYILMAWPTTSGSPPRRSSPVNPAVDCPALTAGNPTIGRAPPGTPVAPAIRVAQDPAPGGTPAERGAR